MDPLSMERAMMNNMKEKTGKILEDWIIIIKEKDFLKHGEMVKYLKTKYSLTHGYASLIVHKSK